MVRADESGAERAVGPPVLDWRVTLLDAAGAPAAAPADARRVRVRMVTAPAFARATDSLHVVWERVFAPPLLHPSSY